MKLIIHTAALLAIATATPVHEPASISLSLNSTSSAQGPQAPGQNFSMSVSYQWSNASHGPHQLNGSFTLPQALELVNSSTSLGGNNPSFKTFGTSFTTVTAGPFNPASNTSGNGSFTLTLRFRQGVTAGTQACIAPNLSEGPASAQSQSCFTAGGSDGGQGNPPIPTATPHWTLVHSLADGTGIGAGTAIFRVTIGNSTPTAAGEPSLVSPIFIYSLASSSPNGVASKIVAVTQGSSPSSGLPTGWTISGTLPGGFINVTGPATVAPTASLPEFYVHVSLQNNILGSTTVATGSLSYRLSTNPASPLTLASMKEIRLVAVLK